MCRCWFFFCCFLATVESITEQIGGRVRLLSETGFGLVISSNSLAGFVMPQPMQSRGFWRQSRHRRTLLLSSCSSYSLAFFSFPQATQVFIHFSVGGRQRLQNHCCCWLNGISRGRGVVQSAPAQRGYLHAPASHRYLLRSRSDLSENCGRCKHMVQGGYWQL